MKHHRSAPHVGRGIALIVATTVCFATLDTLAKLANRYLPVNEIIWGRYVFHGIALTLLMAPKMKWDLVRTAHPGMQILRGVILLISSTLFVSDPLFDRNARVPFGAGRSGRGSGNAAPTYGA